MNLDKFRLYLGQICHDMQRIMVKKNKDYANSIDVYTNFKEVAKLCRILSVDVTKPEGCIQFFCLVKIHRLFKLKREGKAPTNESLQDTAVDLAVYASLLAGYDE